jgi:predicted TIM-barrel fold metal-dependent hydrolase
MQAVDCHVHVFDPQRFPYASDTIHTPGPADTAPVETLLAQLDTHGISHALIVGPMAGYQSDNAPILHAIGHAPDRLKGIAIVEADATARDLERLKAGGIVGVRVDLISRGADYLSRVAPRLPDMLRDLDLVLDIQCEGDQIEAVAALVRAGCGPLVLDHAGRPDLSSDPASGARRTLIDLARHPCVSVKLSGPFRFSRRPFPHEDADAVIRAIYAAFGPHRCVWGSDFPFVRLTNRPTYSDTLDALTRWIPDTTDRDMVLALTPARLFGFGSKPP